MAKTKSKSQLDLGALGGDQDYVTLRVTELLDTFNVLMKHILTRTKTLYRSGGKEQVEVYQPLALRHTPRGMAGHTDCKTFISVPLHDYDAFLVAEHELSHVLFQSDLGMLKGFQQYSVEKFLTRAGLPPGSQEAALYTPGLNQCFFHCWNLLEDLRVRNHWSKIYRGSGELLKERWRIAVESEAYNTAAKDNILAYVSRMCFGVDTPDAPDMFKRFDTHIQHAASTAIHTNSRGCIAITARLFDKIAEAILQEIKDNPGDHGNPNGGTQLWRKTLVIISAKSKPVWVSGMPGEDDVKGDSSSSWTRQFRGNGRSLGKVMTGSNFRDIKNLKKKVDKHDKQKSQAPDDLTDFEKELETGEQEMEDLIDQCIEAMVEEQSRLQQNIEEDETDFQVLQSLQKEVGISCVDVSSKKSAELPPPSQQAVLTKLELERIRSTFAHRLAEEGDDLIVEEHIDALLNRELPDADVFEETVIESGFDILMLVDVSGSMSGPGLSVVNQAIADIKHCVEGTKTTLKVWGFSDSLFVLDEAASLQNPDIRMWGTAMIRSVDMAYEWACKNRSKRAIILVTDGMPSYCRNRRSTGNAQKDFTNVLREIEGDGIPMTSIAVSSWGDSRRMFDQVFGKNRYGYVNSVDQAGAAIRDAATILVKAFIEQRR